MSRVISFISRRPGLGKSTTIVNLASWMALLGKKILVLDLEPGNDLSFNLGLDDINNLQVNLREVLLEHIPLDAAINPSTVKDLCFATLNCSLEEKDSLEEAIRQNIFILSDAIDILEEEFDYILIDTPDLVNDLTRACLAASDSAIIILRCDYEELGLITEPVETIVAVKTTHNRWLELEGVLITFYNESTISRQLVIQARNKFGNLMFKSVIPRNLTIEEAGKAKLPVVLHNIKSFGAEAYLRLAKEILQ